MKPSKLASFTDLLSKPAAHTNNFSEKSWESSMWNSQLHATLMSSLSPLLNIVVCWSKNHFSSGTAAGFSARKHQADDLSWIFLLGFKPDEGETLQASPLWQTESCSHLIKVTSILPWMSKTAKQTQQLRHWAQPSSSHNYFFLLTTYLTPKIDSSLAAYPLPIPFISQCRIWKPALRSCPAKWAL